MMFDPPDYPYKELSETYDDLLLSKNICSDVPDAVDETVITGANSQLAFQSNDSGRFFSTENTFLQDNTLPDLTQNTEMYVIQADTLFSNYEPTLLDENTVNEFLLPLQESSNNKDIESNGPDLLALHSCVICHDIFTTEADLLDHTIAFHASHDVPNDSAIALEENALNKTLEVSDSSSSANPSFETDWLVCRLCQRVLATSLEVEPTEQLCCIAENGKCAVFTRKLHTMFVCDVCSGLFADGEALDKHRMSCYVDDNNFYETSNTENFMTSSEYTDACFNSGQQSTEDLANHLADSQRQIKTGKRSRTYTTSNSNKMWNCGSCNQLFTTARELYRHKRGEDRPEGSPLTAYVCDECDKVLGSMCALHTHKKMHRTSKPGYPCRICGRRFNQSGHLAIHMRMHTGERPYPCDLCPKAFKVKVERDDHRRTHTGERPFACPACPKTFTAAARLREHARIHTDQRPYKCDICGAAFRRPYARTVHTLIHTGEKPHECDICGTAFRRSGDMWKHKRTLHGV